MAETNQLLEVLQADVLGVLQNTPALALANVLADNEGDIEAKVAKALSTLTPTGGKNGLAVVVLLPEVTEGTANLPGPPLTVKVEIRVLENVLLNRAAASGTLMRSSQAALSVLSALHHRHLGHSLLVAEKDPVTPVDVKKGHVSHAVTLFAKFQGFVTPRPLAVQVELAGGAGGGVTVSGILSPPGLPTAFQYAGIYNGRPHYTSDGLPYDATNARTCGAVVYDGGAWRVWWIVEAAMFPMYWASDVSGAVDPEDGIYSNLVYGSGIPTVSVTPGSTLTLTCVSPSSSIRYTTDGSYPSPAKTLYAAPFATPAAGTVIRAAAYVSGQPPGDVLEFTVTE